MTRTTSWFLILLVVQEVSGAKRGLLCILPEIVRDKEACHCCWDACVAVLMIKIFYTGRLAIKHLELLQYNSNIYIMNRIVKTFLYFHCIIQSV